jgi:hypothetical protein
MPSVGKRKCSLLCPVLAAMFWLPIGSQFKTENMKETNMHMKIAILARYTRVSLTAFFTVLD